MNTKWKNVASTVVCGMPLIYYSYVVLFWLAASAALGQWAQPSVNDPKGFFLSTPATFGTVLMCLSLVVAPLVFVVGNQRHKLKAHVLAYVACLGISVLLFSLDLFQMTTWFLD